MATAVVSKSSKQEIRRRKRLIDRINREFENKFFIGDIVISDQEYAILLADTRMALAQMVLMGRAAADSVTLAVTLVQIGIRKYDGTQFWPYVEEELRVVPHHRHQKLLGEAFINTLRRHGKYITDPSERVQSILFHGFVSNYYSKGLFELLFQYYAKDLERDIYRNTSEQMQALMDTLASKADQDEKQSEAFTDQFMAKGSRAYKLRRHTLQAISANPVHSRMRLRRLLRLIDQAFWKNAVPKNPTSRLTILFKEWIEESPAFQKEYRLYQSGEIRNRGKKHFSSPYLFAHIRDGYFELKLPAQIVSEINAENLEWEITTNTRTFRLTADTYPVLTGYKTEEGKAAISPGELFGDIRCQLVRGQTAVRKFPNLPRTPVRFFDMDGDYAPRLFKIPMCAYTYGDSALYSSALQSKIRFGSMTRWDFEFQMGDLVILPDGTGMIVGEQYTDGFLPRGQVPLAEYRQESGEEIPVYAAPPELLLTIPKGKVGGTVLYCNDVRHRLSECKFTEFDAKDSRGMQAILVPMNQFAACRANGFITVILDIPGAAYAKHYAFVLVHGLSVHFEGAPYVFEERGAVIFPASIRVSGNYEKLRDENGFQFTINGSEPRLSVVIDGEIPLSIQIPMLSWSTDQVNWQVMPAGELWHTAFFEIRKLYLRSPIPKISFFPDTDAPDDEETEMRLISAEYGSDGIYTVDMTRFRSWLTRAVMKNNIIMKLGSEEYTFATVYTRSLVASYDVNADYEAGTLTWLCDIIGKADYYLDIVHLASGAVLADKQPLTDGKLVLKDRLRSGLYKFTLYEADEDDSGFDDPVYEELLCTQRKLTNRNDASGQFLKIIKFKSAHNSNLYTDFRKAYFVSHFEKIDRHTYEGQLLADREDTGLKVEITFLKEDDMRFFHVVAWHEEEETNVDLLFDRKYGTLVLDQEPGLRSSESHRRYRELTYGDYIYFGLLYDKLPDAPPVKPAPPSVIRPAPAADRRAIPIEDMNLSVRTYNALNRANIRSAQQLEKLTYREFFRIRNMGKKNFDELTERMTALGLTVPKPEPADLVKQEAPEMGKEKKSPMPVNFEAADRTAKTMQPANRAVPLEELGFSAQISLTLLQHNVATAGDIADLTPFAWKQMKSLTKNDMETISQEMRELGLRLKR